MSTGVTLAGFDPSTLLSYYQSKLPVAPSTSTLTSATEAANSATANDDPPWEATPPAQQERDTQVLGITNFVDTSDVPLSAGTTTDSKTEQDNQKLFALYTAVNNLSYLASMSNRSGMTAGQLAGFNTRYQEGLQQVQDYVANTSFNNITLQASAPSASATSTVGVSFGSYTYDTRTLTTNDNIDNPPPGLSADQSFTISVKKGGVSTDVPIDLSQVNGPLTLDNVISYANQQLSQAGFSSRLQRTITKGTIDDPTDASYGLAVAPSGSETVSLSAPDATPALYVAGNSGITTSVQANTTSTTAADNDPSSVTAADQQGRLVKLSDLDSTTPQSTFSATASPTTGLTTAQSTVVDSSGNVYVVGNATGDFGNQLNQGTQDTYLTKYDSAGNVVWTQMLGSAGTASAYSLALNPKGGVVVAGSTTGQVMQTAVSDGNNDSFVAEYDANGNQSWVKQIQTLNNNQAAAVSVDASGNVYIGGQVKGVIGSGQTNNGGNDAYVAKLDAKGNVVYEQQSGTSGNDSTAATAVTSDGSLLVASVVNGHAVVSKYANGDATQAPEWQEDLGALQAGGTIGGMTVSNGKVYITGTTSNANLTAGGQATIANASSGGTDAYVFSLTDNGTSATPNTVTYVGTGATDQGNALTVGSDGTVYLAGTTTGTFAGQTRNIPSVNNMFVSALGPDGSIQWTHQYGGADGTSTGQGVAFDAQGSSVLDALGLPRGTIAFNQSVDLTKSTTLRAGDSFQIKIAGATTRTATITIDQGETLSSLSDKINAELQNTGTASTAYGANGETLKIAVNAGVTATLIAGPANSDALSRLGLSAQTLTGKATSSSSASSATSSSSTTTAYGLGLPADTDISTAAGGGAARAQLLSVLSTIQKIYQSENTPASSTSSTSTASSSSGSVPSALTAQLANYTLALSLFSSSSSSSSTTSSSISSLV
jgi:hypothetical protein